MTPEQLERMAALKRRNRRFMAKRVREEFAKSHAARLAVDPREREYWLDRKRVHEARTGKLDLRQLETLFTVLEREALYGDSRDADEYMVLAQEVAALGSSAGSTSSLEAPP